MATFDDNVSITNITADTMTVSFSGRRAYVNMEITFGLNANSSLGISQEIAEAWSECFNYVPSMGYYFIALPDMSKSYVYDANVSATSDEGESAIFTVADVGTKITVETTTITTVYAYGLFRAVPTNYVTINGSLTIKRTPPEEPPPTGETVTVYDSYGTAYTGILISTNEDGSMNVDTNGDGIAEVTGTSTYLPLTPPSGETDYSQYVVPVVIGIGITAGLAYFLIKKRS